MCARKSHPRRRLITAKDFPLPPPTPRIERCLSSLSMRMEMTAFRLLFFLFSAERHYNEMTRHRQFPAMQLPEGAQSLNNPKNVSSVASPSLTSSLINNNCLLTLREMMQHQQQYQLQQYQLQQQQHIKRERPEEEENAKGHIISTPSSPNSSSAKLSPKYHAEKHERESPFAIAVKSESFLREPRNESGANCFKQHVKAECQPPTTGRTVREELEASRSKIPKPGKSSPRKLLHFMLDVELKASQHSSPSTFKCEPLSRGNNNPHDAQFFYPNGH
jgi:hypothetical protein